MKRLLLLLALAAAGCGEGGSVVPGFRTGDGSGAPEGTDEAVADETAVDALGDPVEAESPAPELAPVEVSPADPIERDVPGAETPGPEVPPPETTEPGGPATDEGGGDGPFPELPAADPGPPDAPPPDLAPDPQVLDPTPDPTPMDLPPDPAPDPACIPQCAGKECGPNGCGGSCGSCPGGAPCIAATGKCQTCNASCAGRECGGDGCGGSCGSCDASESCIAGQCISPEPCTGLPQTWGPAGAIATMKTPGDSPTVKAECFDESFDGIGDNGLATLASLGGFGFDVNQMIQEGIDSGAVGMVFDFDGVQGFVNAGPFPLTGLRGRPANGSGTQYEVDPASYDGNCTPLVAFQGATIADKTLKAGPGFFILVLPVGGGTLSFALEKARMRGTVTSGGPAGVTLSGGVIGGLLSQEALDDLVAGASAQCSGPDPPQFCDFLDYIPMFLQMDTDTNGDGKPDAMSTCFLLTLKATKVVGYM